VLLNPANHSCETSYFWTQKKGSRNSFWVNSALWGPCSVADLDLGSRMRCFFTPWIRIPDKLFSGSGPFLGGNFLNYHNPCKVISTKLGYSRSGSKMNKFSDSAPRSWIRDKTSQVRNTAGVLSQTLQSRDTVRTPQHGIEYSPSCGGTSRSTLSFPSYGQTWEQGK
jgi:hypothetical protein